MIFTGSQVFGFSIGRLFVIVPTLLCISACTLADGAIVFSDVTKETGITFTHTDGGSGRRYIVESVSSGLALFDYDRDGDVDIYFLNGAPLKGTKFNKAPKNELYRNEGSWKFTNVTDRAGVGNTGFGLGVAAGDYDNDGDLDIYVNNYGPNVLYRNNGDGTFTNVTSQAGVSNGHKVGAAAHFLDMDKDGDLDLFVANYLGFTYENHMIRTSKGIPKYAGPMDFPPMPNNLFRNNGDGTFTDVSIASGVAEHKGWGMGGVCADYDDDGDTDVYIANDVYANFLFENDGTGKFEEIGLISGLAYDLHGDDQGSMGVDCADYDNDGRLDFYQTSYAEELTALYRNLGNSMFEDVTMITGAGAETLEYVTWGTGLVDFDNDGDRDIFVACGHLQDNIELYNNSTTSFSQNTLLMNTGDGKFVNVSDQGGDGMKVKLRSRAAGFDDLDNDGDVDVVILNSRREPTILRNDSPSKGHWLQVRLKGVKTNRDGIGARVKVVSGDLALIDEVHSGRGYQSHYGMRLNFGLGNRDKVDRIEVRWIGGGVDNIENIRADQLVTVTESSAGSLIRPGSVEEQDRALRKEQLDVARSLLTAFPDDTNAAFLIGMAYFEQGNVIDAEEYLEKSLKLQPLRADACDHLGRIALLKGQYDKALMLFRRAIENDPAMPGIHFRIAKAYMFLGKLKEAVLELQKDIEIFPGAGQSYSLLGETYLQLKEYQKAKENFEAAIRIKPDYTKAYYGLATACARLGLKNESKESRQKFKQLEAEDQKAGRHWRQVLEPLIVTRRSVAHTHTDIGRVYHEHGYPDKAEQLWQKAATLDPNNTDCRFHLSALYLQNSKLSDALRLYEQITQIDSENGISYFFIGNINSQLNRFDDAEKAYKKVIEVAPKRSDGYRALAQLYLQINRNLPDVKTLASRAVELEPTAMHYFILAAACDKNGDRAGALAAIGRAIELDPDNMQYRRTQLLIQERK